PCAHTGRIQMNMSRLRSCALALTFAGACLIALPAAAQKQGGSITVGLELDISGLDPLKVCVFDTSANMAAALIFDTLTYLDDDGKAQGKLAEAWASSNDYKTWSY